MRNALADPIASLHILDPVENSLERHRGTRVNMVTPNGSNQKRDGLLLVNLVKNTIFIALNLI